MDLRVDRRTCPAKATNTGRSPTHTSTTSPMSSLHPLRLAGVLAVALLLAACKALEPEPVKVALLSVPTEDTGDGYASAPIAFFIQGTGIGLSTTLVGNEGCVVRRLTTGTGNQDFDYIDAGPSITARFDGPAATLTKVTANGRTTYELPAGTSLSFTPGQTITFSIPGAAGGFPASLVGARTAEAFTAGPVTLPASTSEDMTVTWTPVPEIAGSAMFYSIRYSSPGMTQVDREIACVFRDDGTGVIGSTMLTEFRQSPIRLATAQRARVTTSQTGAVITHVTSTFNVQLTLTDIP